MFGLVTVERVQEVHPIEGSEHLEQVIVDGKSVVTRIGAHQVDDLVVYYRPGCYIPRKGFSFLNGFKATICANGARYLAFRIKKINVMKTPSFGFVISIPKFMRHLRKYFHKDGFIPTGHGVQIRLKKFHPIEKMDFSALANAVPYINYRKVLINYIYGLHHYDLFLGNN